MFEGSDWIMFDVTEAYVLEVDVEGLDSSWLGGTEVRVSAGKVGGVGMTVVGLLGRLLSFSWISEGKLL